MGGRGGSSGMRRNSLNSLGLKVESEIDESKFNFYDGRYGNYAKRLAQEANMFGVDNLVVSYSNGKNIAYASIDTESDSLESIMSTGGKTGTALLTKVMQYQAGRGKGLSWMADNPESINYYDKIGLKKYGKGNSKSKLYTVSSSNIEDAIRRIKR